MKFPATTLTGEAANRLAIQELVNAYARYADRRETEKQASLFTKNGVIEIYQGEPGVNKPVSVLNGYDELFAAFAMLNNYEVTMHLNGQSTIQFNGDQATGETSCLSHHLWVEDGTRILMIMAIRYYDDIIFTGSEWLFTKRKLIIDFTDRRPSAP